MGRKADQATRVPADWHGVKADSASPGSPTDFNACPEERPSTADRKLQGWLLAGVVALTLTVFAGVGSNEFVHFDDNINIYENPHLSGLSAASLKWMFTDTAYAKRYMPLGWLTYAATQQLFGLNPRAFHAVSLLLHLANVVVLFLVLKRLSRLASPGKAKAALWCAAAGALCWAVSPLRVEAVAWASSLIYCPATLLALIWVMCWLRAQDETLSAAARKASYWCSVGAYAASLLTYPLALFAPVILFALEVFPLRRAGLRMADWRGANSRWLWLDKLPFLALAGAGLMLTVWARTFSEGDYNKTVGVTDFSTVPRVMQACYVWVYYLWKPWAPLDLAPVYPTLHGFQPLSLPFVFCAALLVAITTWLFTQRQSRPGLFVLWCCHLLILVPFLGLTEHNHSPADRYAYLHGLLWSALVTTGLGAWWKTGRRAQLAGVVLAAACLAFALLAWQQVPAWRHTIALHRHLLARLGEDPARARYDEVLGVHYLRAGLTNDAIASFENAIRFDAARRDRQFADEGIPARAHLSLGNIFARQGQFAAAIEHYRAAWQADPGSASAAVNLGLTYAELRRFDEAQQSFEAALRLNPASVSAHHNLGTLLRQLGREEQARRHFDEARRLFAQR